MRSWKNIVLIVLLLTLAFSAGVQAKDTFVKASRNLVDTLDPQLMVASATMELSFNVFNSLLIFDPEDRDTLHPSLSTQVPSYDNGLIVDTEDGGVRIEFPVRQGVLFHNGSELRPEDIEYTIKRALLIGGQPASIRLLSSTLLDKGSFQVLVDEIGYDEAFEVLDQAVTVEGNSVIFHLPKPFVPFLGIMADGGASLAILNKEWCSEVGAWPGTKETGQEFMGLTIEETALHDKMMGTGPFKLASWEPGERIVLERFDEYWEGPATMSRVIRRIVEDTSTAIMLLQRGDVDWIDLDSPADLPRVEGSPGVKTITDIPTAWLMKMNFVFDITEEGNRNIGDGQIGPNGIPGDFFSDINVRKAFQYSFGYDVFINDVFLGSALKPYGPVLIGFPTANPDNPQYYYDPEKAEEHFKKAWNGEVWEKGFKMRIPYSAGSLQRQRALEILKDNIEALNPKFEIELFSLPWASYLAEITAKKLPISLLGMLPQVFDPYLPLFQHMHSSGSYARDCGYDDMAREKYDVLIDELGTNYDEERRMELSHQLQLYAYEDAHSIFHFQNVANIAIRDWVQGYIPLPQPFNVDFYQIYH